MSKQRDFVVYDIETDKKQRPISCVCYSFLNDEFSYFLHRSLRNEAVAFLKEKITISFNGVFFDSRCLLGKKRNVKCVGRSDIVQLHWRGVRWYEIDLFVLAKKYLLKCSLENALRRQSPGGLGLDALARENLGDKKKNIRHRPEYYYDIKDYERLFEYNRKDVALTKDLFLLFARQAYVKTGKGKGFRPSLKIPSFLGNARDFVDSGF